MVPLILLRPIVLLLLFCFVLNGNNGQKEMIGGKDPGQLHNSKQPCPTNPPSDEDGVLAERRALLAHLVALEQVRGLPPWLRAPQGSGPWTRYIRSAAYKQFHADVLRWLALLESAGPNLMPPLPPVEQPQKPAMLAIPNQVPQDPVQPHPLVPLPQGPAPSPTVDPVSPVEQPGAPGMPAPASHPVWVWPWGPWSAILPCWVWWGVPIHLRWTEQGEKQIKR